MLKLIHLDRAMRYAAWMERANDPHEVVSSRVECCACGHSPQAL